MVHNKNPDIGEDSHAYLGVDWETVDPDALPPATSSLTGSATELAQADEPPQRVLSKDELRYLALAPLAQGPWIMPRHLRRPD